MYSPIPRWCHQICQFQWRTAQASNTVLKSHWQCKSFSCLLMRSSWLFHYHWNIPNQRTRVLKGLDLSTLLSSLYIILRSCVHWQVNCRKIAWYYCDTECQRGTQTHSCQLHAFSHHHLMLICTKVYKQMYTRLDPWPCPPQVQDFHM